MVLPIQEVDWMGALPEAVRGEVLASMTLIRLSKGEFVYRQEDESNALYRINSGQVELNSLALNGREYVVGLIEAGNCFGEMGVIDGLPRANNAYVTKAAELQVLSRVDFLRLRDQHSEISDHLLLFVNTRLRLCCLELESLSLTSLPQQLARRLYYLANTHSHSNDTGPVSLNLNRESLGKSLGVSRQSIHNALKVLANDGAISIKDGQILIPNPEILDRFFTSPQL